MDESGLGIALKLLLVIALVAVNGMFTAAEFAIVTVRRARIEQLADQGNPFAALVKKAVANLNKYLATIQLGITMAAIGLGWIGEPFLANLVEPALTSV